MRKTKTCSRCGETQDRASQFHRNRNNGDGYDHRCKDCKRIIAKEHRAKNHDKLLAQERRYREENRWYFREYNKRWRTRNPDRHKKHQNDYTERKRNPVD